MKNLLLLKSKVVYYYSSLLVIICWYQLFKTIINQGVIEKWVLDIDEEITANLDKYYFKQCLDNLIINAISYCHKGKIEVALKQNKYGIHFSISDEGVGIPIEELYDIFAEFTVSSRTRTLEGGRGIGLTLCKKVIEFTEVLLKQKATAKKVLSLALFCREKNKRQIRQNTKRPPLREILSSGVYHRIQRKQFNQHMLIQANKAIHPNKILEPFTLHNK